MAETSIRVAVRSALLAALQAHDDLTGVQVERMYPGDAIERDTVYLGATRPSTADIPTMKAGRKQLNDEFVIDIHIEARRPNQTAEEAETRCEELMATVEDVLLEDTSLGGIDGLLWATPTGERNGPDPYPTKEGAVAYARSAVECKTRLSP